MPKYFVQVDEELIDEPVEFLNDDDSIFPIYDPIDILYYQEQGTAIFHTSLGPKELPCKVISIIIETVVLSRGKKI